MLTPYGNTCSLYVILVKIGLRPIPNLEAKKQSLDLERKENRFLWVTTRLAQYHFWLCPFPPKLTSMVPFIFVKPGFLRVYGFPLSELSVIHLFYSILFTLQLFLLYLKIKPNSQFNKNTFFCLMLTTSSDLSLYSRTHPVLGSLTIFLFVYY